MVLGPKYGAVSGSNIGPVSMVARLELYSPDTITRSKLTARRLLRKRGDHQAKQSNDHLHLCCLATQAVASYALATEDVKLNK
jgi:hypothetical protein